MNIGVVFPQTEIGTDPLVIRDFAQAAEDLGYSHVMAYDHVLGAVKEGRERPLSGYDLESVFHEPFVLFGFLAAVTKRIELATGIIILPQRQTALVAKQTAEVDVLSGGRLRLGIGAGYNWVEYESLNENFRNRGRRQEEQVTVLRKLWTEPIVDFTGEWHRIDRAGIRPLPGRIIPIWFGGSSEAAIDRAARIGDGMFPLFSPSTDGGKAAIEHLWASVERHGRDRSSFGLEGQVEIGAGPERWARHIEGWRSAGATHVCVRTMNAGLATPQEHIDAIRRYKAEIG